MEKITRTVRDLESAEREAVEALLGQKLRENQQVIVQVITLQEEQAEEPATAQPAGPLPAWCNVYEGLSDAEIADIEAVTRQRSDLSRPS